MKRMFSIFSAVLALVFCLSALPVAAAPVATASIGTVSAARGETVTVPVSITEVGNIGAIALHIRYDGNVLECVEAEAVGIMDQMDMNTANTEPKNHPNEVWLTGMGLKGMNGSGDLMLIDFKVKENAPAGLTAIEFTADGQELILGSPIEALEMALTNGGIMVKEGEAPPATKFPLQSDVVTTAAPSTTAAPKKTTVADATATAADNVPTQGDAPATEPTTVATVVVTNEDGTNVTDAQGQPMTTETVGISVDKAVGKPGDTVAVNVSLSAVTDLTALGISIMYDKEALEYVSGEGQGFFADMSFVDIAGADGMVTIGGTNPKPVSGEGVIATLTFKVAKNATSGAHALKIDPESMLMANTADLPFTGFDGAVTVEGGKAPGASTTVYVVIGVALAAVLALIVAVIARKKKAVAPKAEKPTAPKKDKPVLPTDISDEDGFDVDGE